jgi:hypothetical protein
MAMGVPGCPELAAWTASIARVRIVLMQVASSGCRSDLITGFLSTALAMKLSPFGCLHQHLWSRTQVEDASPVAPINTTTEWA